MNVKLCSALAVGLLSTAPALAAPVTLDFEGTTSFGFVTDFYNGGTDSGGASGANYLVSFGGDALAFKNDELGPYFSNPPSPDTIMAPVGADAALNRAQGFAGAVSFAYSAIESTIVNVFSDLNGAGIVLATFALAANAQSGCSDTAFCHWDAISMDVLGIAKSIQFGTAANVAMFDNLTLSPVPLPAAAWLLLSALGGLGTLARRKRMD